VSSERIESSDQGTTGTDAADSDVTRRARTAAEERDQMGDSQDPEVLAAQIEATRDDLAETLDLIADKVSPKKVAARGRKQVTDTVKEKAALAKDVVTEKAAIAKEAVTEKTASAKEAVAERRASSTTTETETVVVPVTGAPLGTDGLAGEPTYGAGAYSTSTTSGYGTAGTARTGSAGGSFGAQLSQGWSTYVAPGGQVRKEVLGGGAAALAALLLSLLGKRRRNKRSLRLK